MALPTTGYPITKTDLDNRIGSAVVTLRDAFINIVALKALFDDTTILPDANLTTLGYSASDITTIRTALADLSKLNDISKAGAVQASPNDFWFTAKHVAGLNFR